MAKNKKMENEVKATEIQVVESEATEVEATEPKKKISLKKVLVGVGAGAAAIGGVAAAILLKKSRDKEILEYMESCGNDGTDLPDDSEDPELKAMFESEKESEE